MRIISLPRHAPSEAGWALPPSQDCTTRTLRAHGDDLRKKLNTAEARLHLCSESEDWDDHQCSTRFAKTATGRASFTGRMNSENAEPGGYWEFQWIRNPRSLGQLPSSTKPIANSRNAVCSRSSKAHLKLAPSARFLDPTKMSEGYDDHDDTP